MQYTNINLILDRITRHPLLQDVTLESAVDYAVEFIRIMGIPDTFIEKTAEIDIKNYRGELPCDFYEMIQVRNIASCGNDHRHTFRYTTDTFHMSEHKSKYADFTYKLQGDVIFVTPIKNGKIEIAYRAMPVDDDGFPMIPDNSSFARALELYIKKQYLGIQYDLGKITMHAMQRADQEYAWAVGQAQTDLIRPNLDQMQAITNMWNKFLPDVTQDHRHGFLHEGTKELIKIK